MKVSRAGRARGLTNRAKAAATTIRLLPTSSSSHGTARTVSSSAYSATNKPFAKSCLNHAFSSVLGQKRWHSMARNMTTVATEKQSTNSDSKSHLSIEDFVRGCTLMHQISQHGDAILPEIRRTMEEFPSLLDFADYDYRTPLHVAASEGHFGVCQYLLTTCESQKKDIMAWLNRMDRWGGTPLDDAHRHGHTEIVGVLRNAGASFGSRSLQHSITSLIHAASVGNVKELQALIDYGDLDLNQGDYDKRTALHLAAGEGHVEVVKLLCEAGADVNVKDRWDNHPLDDAYTVQDENHAACIQVLESYGAQQGPNASPHPENNIDQEALLDLLHEYGKIRDGKLTLDWQDVKDLLKGIGENPTDEVVQTLFKVADDDGNGIISVKEFVEHSDTFLGGRPARIILVVGGPGSGKGVLSQRLVEECGVVHVSSGDLLRQEVAQGTTLGKQVKEIMQSGGLVSSAIMVTLMKKHMRNHPGKRILLDGFPRSQENARDLVALCGKPELALHLDCDDTILLERIIKRGESGDRADDNFHTAIERVRAYHKYHHVTLEFLREERVPIVYLDCSTTPEGVWDQLRAIGRLMRSVVKLPLAHSS